MTPFEAIVLGLVEGVTEFLPVAPRATSSWSESLLGTARRIDSGSLAAFTIIIQGGAIVAVLYLYGHRVRQIAMGVLHADPAGVRLARNLAIAFVPSAVVGLAVGHLVTERLFAPGPVLAALAIGGLQCLALWPGTSRAMVTILAGVAVGMERRDAAEFSFLLGLPTLTGACGYATVKSISAGGASAFASLGITPLVVGIGVATVSAVVGVRWLVRFLGHHGLAPFGWYRIVLTAVLALLIWTGDVVI